MYKPLNIVFVAVALLASSRLEAAVPSGQPDAGAIMRSQVPQRELPETLPATEDTMPMVNVGGGGEIQVMAKVFRFHGYEGLTTEAELQSLVAGNIGKRIDMDGLQGLLDKVTAHLKTKGWFLAQAYLPEQDLVGGIIRIAIVQGKSDGGIRIKRNDSVRICDDRLEGYTRKGAIPGEALNLRRLEHSLLLVKDLPGIHARSMISPGSVTDTSIVTFEVNEDPLVSGAAWGDNMGSRYTGAWSGNIQVTLNDPLRCGDQFSVMYTGSAGLNQGVFSYNFPIGFNGLRARLSWTLMNYKLVEELESLDYKGESSVIQGGLSWPIVKNRKTTVIAGVDYTDKHLIDRQGENGLQGKTVKKASARLSLLDHDKWLGGGSTALNISFDFGNFYQPARYDTQHGVMGNFASMTGSCNRLQKVSSRVMLNLSSSSQFAFKNLDSSEKLYLGGPYGVRAYPVGEAGGDCGQLLNVDLKYQLPVSSAWGKVELGGFYDAGRIRLNHNRYKNDVSNATGRNEYWLEGTGVSLNWAISKSHLIQCNWAHTIGENPGRNKIGKNSDGKSDNNRFWLQGLVKF
jgi:hemolysin activation/secretion protein